MLELCFKKMKLKKKIRLKPGQIQFVQYDVLPFHLLSDTQVSDGIKVKSLSYETTRLGNLLHHGAKKGS